MIPDSNQAYLAKMSGCELQEELHPFTNYFKDYVHSPEMRTILIRWFIGARLGTATGFGGRRGGM